MNARHLHYIATRPGAAYNKGCGFCLWGHPPGALGIQAIPDLTQAQRVVRDISQKHTLYRAVVSVGKDIAQSQGLYHREEWEKLVERNIGTIAKEMQIKPENFCWYASFHCEKGHPHIHILYWDNGSDPRPDFVPEDLFKARTERIRAAFAGDLNKEQILETQKEQREELKQLRATLQAICREANPEKAVNLKQLYSSQALEGLSQQFAELIRNIPAKGSLRYAYLPAQYKELVNNFINHSLQQPDLMKELQQYGKLTRKISLLYANGEKAAAEKMEQATQKLYNALGNEVMAVIREVKEEILLTSPVDAPDLRKLLTEAATELAPAMPAYQTALQLLPRERISVASMYQLTGFPALMNSLVSDLMADARLRLRLENYALQMAGIDLDSKPDAPSWQAASQEGEDRNGSPESDGYRFRGKLLSADEWERYSEAAKEIQRELQREITQRLREDANWTEEATRTATVSLVSGFMSLLSQMVCQQRASQSLQVGKGFSKDLSKEAKKDRRAQQLQASEMFDDY